MQERDQHLGLILTPMYAIKRGLLHVTESTAYRLLSDNQIFFDSTFFMRFEPPSDKRDERPLAYSGRIASPHTVKLHKSVWKQAGIVTSNTTEPAQHVAKNDLQVIEDLGDDSLPESTSDHGGISAGQKFSQPRHAAMKNLLMSSLENFNSGNEFNGLCLCDLNANVGCGLRAFIQMYPSVKFPMRMFLLCDDDIHKDFLQDIAHER